MRPGLLGAVVLALALATGLSAAQEPAPLSFRDTWEKAFHEADVILLARVVRATHGVTLEPVEYLKAGLDGDQIAVTDTAAGLAAIAGKDTLGAIVLLARNGGDWIFRRGDSGVRGGFMVVSQHDWSRLVGRVRTVSEDLSLDSLVARADAVVLAEALPAGGETNFRVVERLKGLTRETIAVVTPAPLPAGKRTCLCLSRIDPRRFRAMPYTWFPELPGVDRSLSADSVASRVRVLLSSAASH